MGSKRTGISLMYVLRLCPQYMSLTMTQNMSRPQLPPAVLPMPSIPSYSGYSYPPHAPVLSLGSSLHTATPSVTFDSIRTSSLTSPKFQDRAHDYTYEVTIYPERRNDLPAAYSVHLSSREVSQWCSRCDSWVLSNSKDTAVYSTFKHHLDKKDCLIQYALRLGVLGLLLPGQSISMSSGYSSAVSSFLDHVQPPLTCPGANCARARQVLALLDGHIGHCALEPHW
jgi:hypothetical protein